MDDPEVAYVPMFLADVFPPIRRVRKGFKTAMEEFGWMPGLLQEIKIRPLG